MTCERNRIVVGVDGSPGARVAARWALAEAARLHADLDVVACWHIPYLADAGPYGLVSVTPDDLMASARHEAERCLEGLDLEREAARRSGSEVQVRAVEGDAAEALVTESKGALMVVIGRHGRGALGRVLLGSVGSALLAHASCPVVVVPSDASAT